jgi:outer membrane protein OmpA-like peptidoglycan-associated protein
MRALFCSAVISAFILLPTASFAGPWRTKDDIVKFFAQQVKLGKSRGICVGTEEQCAQQEGQGKAGLASAGLDMLVNFDFNSAALTDEAKAKLSEFAKALEDNRLQSYNFAVEGHTDASGSDTYNDALSLKRAESVTAFLVANGIESSRLKAIGLGKKEPRVKDPYDPVNRRVEMRLSAQ